MSDAVPPAPAFVIVNADDYGYFRGVSEGILEAARNGIVTATGVFATSARFDQDAEPLRACAALDVGVHLNLTDGRPLTPDMRKRLMRSDERFPGKYLLARAVLTGAIPVRDVGIEWRAQIERCLDRGLRLQFLNSHEHVHMLPVLFPLAQALADEYRIAHVRFTDAGLERSGSASAIVRGAIVKALAVLNRRRARRPAPEFRGLGASGRLDLAGLEAVVAGMRPGRIYELMCHPGRLDRAELTDRRLLAYHDWEGELAALTDPRARALLEQRGIRLIGYRDLEVRDGRLSVLPGPRPAAS